MALHLRDPKMTDKIQVPLPTGRVATIRGFRSLRGNQFFKLTYDRRSSYVKRSDLVGDRAEVRKRLATDKLIVSSNPDWSAILESMESVTDFPRQPMIESPGWDGAYYAEASGFVHSPPGVRKGRALFSSPGGKRANLSGSHGEWLEQVAVPLTGQSLPMLVVLAALAASLIRFIEPHNFGFELWGPPARGKTTLLALMASVARRPDALASFNATPLGLQRLFAEHQDMPYPIDEANLIQHGDRRYMRDFAFQMAHGASRVTALAPERANYRFIFATSANRPIYEVVGEIDNDTSAAALQRLFPLRVSDDALGVFNRLPEGFSTSAAFAAHLADAMRRQHGTPLRAFLTHLVAARHSDPDGFDQRIRRKVGEFAQQVGLVGTAVGRTRATGAFGLLYAVGSFAKARGVLPSEWDCLDACLAAYRNYEGQLAGHTPLASRLAAVLARPETLRLDPNALVRLIDHRFQRHGAFIRPGMKGRLELLLTREFRREHFPDWDQLISTPDFALLNLGKGVRREVQRTVRIGKGKEWFACFRIPAELTPPRAGR
jgi:hypothetical protein